MAATLAALALVAPGSVPAARTPEPAPAPGVPAPGLTAFTLPASGTATYRLLVIPVRFPEDLAVAPGGLDALRARLSGGGNELDAYFGAATGGRLRIAVTLAPVLTAAHPRTWYTIEGEGNTGYGLGFDAFPHNARGLVEEVTAASIGAVDFRTFDNTGDGFADGVLLLHSGPEAPEGSGDLEPSVLMAHAFTLAEPKPRGDGTVFPYAVAATGDGVGVWAHEVGHLFGLHDLYVGNQFFPSEGVGPWALMATGANAGGGDTPSGLSAPSRLALGIDPVVAFGDRIDLGAVPFARFHRPAGEDGDRFFLVERRSGADGLFVPEPATLIYAVDDTRPDNRNPIAPRVELRAVVCRGAGPCAALLDDDTDPSLRDAAGPTGLELVFDAAGVTGVYRLAVPLRLESVRLLDPDGARQRLVLGIRNLDPTTPVTPSTVIAPLDPGIALEEDKAPPPPGPLQPGELRADTVTVVATGPAGLPPGPTRIEVELAAGSAPAVKDTITLALGGFGLPADSLTAFTAVNLVPGRENPWNLDGDAGVWMAGELEPRADGVIRSPWFTVPEDGRLVLDHAWDWAALAPDAAQDGGQVILERQTAPESALAPRGGWGWFIERPVGNALSGREALSGAGDRIHVLDLGPHAGETVRVRLRAAGDVTLDPGGWTVRSVRAVAAGSAFTSMETVAAPVFRVRLEGAGTDATWSLYGGPFPTTPTLPLAEGNRADDRVLPDPGAAAGSRRSYDLIWVEPDGRAGSLTLDAVVPAATADERRLFAGPNPLPGGGEQTWSVLIGDEDVVGLHRFILFDVAGRRLAERRAVFSVPGTRSVTWNGRSESGTRPAAGVYILQCRFPGGDSTSRKVVLLP